MAGLGQFAVTTPAPVAGTPSTIAAPERPNEKGAPLNVPVVTAKDKATLTVTGSSMTCWFNDRTCTGVFKVTSDKPCNLLTPEAVFVARTGETVDMIVRYLPRRDSILAAGTPKPVPILFENVSPLRYESLPVGGSMIFLCDLLNRSPAEQTIEPKLVASQLTIPKPAIPIELAISGSLGLALLAILIPCAGLSTAQLQTEIGAPEWKVSMLAGITVGGALVNSVLSTTLLVSGVFAEKETYTLISALFAALIGLSPFVYALNRAPNPAFVPTTPGGAPEFVGATWSFLLASFFTIWGNAGQIALFWCVLVELWMAGKLPASFMNIFHVVNGLTLMLLLVYAVVSVGRNMKPPAAGGGAAREDGAAEAGGAVRQWSWI